MISKEQGGQYRYIFIFYVEVTGAAFAVLFQITCWKVFDTSKRFNDYNLVLKRGFKRPKLQVELAMQLTALQNCWRLQPVHGGDKMEIPKVAVGLREYHNGDFDGQEYFKDSMEQGHSGK